MTLNFDHELILAEKYDALYSYKKVRGYLPGSDYHRGMIVGVKNRDGNAYVRFHQADTLELFFTRLEDRDVKIARYHVYCGSYGADIVRTVAVHSRLFYLHASNCQSRREAYERHEV